MKVYKNPAGENEEINLKQADIAVNADNKNLLEITLPPVAENEVYRLKLEDGAVNEEGKTANGNKAIAPADRDITIGKAPGLDANKRPYLSGQKIIVPFDAPINILDTKKIKYQLNGETITPAALTVMNNNLVITLQEAPAANQVYRIQLDTGAITGRNTVPAVAIQPDNKDIYSTPPILDRASRPYILNNKLVATFNLNIAIKEWEKVKVYKNPAESNEEVALSDASVDVNSTHKNLLEITLPPVAENEVYRLKLEAGAVNEENRPHNTNKAIEPADLDITIGAAPARPTPYLSSGKKIIIPFDTPISILDDNKIKYIMSEDEMGPFGTPTKPRATPQVLNNNQLEITLNDWLREGQRYHVTLAAGALDLGRNKPSTGTILLKIPVPKLTLADVTPVFTSKTEFSVSFPVEVAIHGGGGESIEVRKKNVDELEFSLVLVSNRDIAVDRADPKKINITLTDGEEATPYTQVWKVVFPAHTMDAATSGVANSVELATNEIKPGLTDLYSWDLVAQESAEKWHARSSHTSVVFKDKIWVLGGKGLSNIGLSKLQNDVWSSPDGATWTESTPPNYGDGNAVAKNTTGPDKNWWSAREAHTSVVFNPGDGDRIWVLGGKDDENSMNDVWSSPDGATWTESTPPNDEDENAVAKNTTGPNKNWWSVRHLHSSVVFRPDGEEEKIWVIGGQGLSDIWSSADGRTWTEKSNHNAGWTSIWYHGNVVLDDKIWITGGLDGGDKNKFALSSTDGLDWKRYNGPNVVRVNMVKYDDRLWAFGTVALKSSDIPTTGSWKTEKTLQSGMYYTQVLVFKNRIWVLGGDYGGSPTNEIWHMGPGE